ncbi:ABC transporter ATP-binding protein [Propionivibrio sp.]|uniref:ABC transporter ATP-binding protein n=1 Tax=Propionivibrio sp. TaxID=2212460 RepID=UPI00260A23CA|nr:ABC transporter ATP-binding protein [Propionivibrio sp.]
MNRVTIEVRNLDFSYGAKPVLRNINLCIEAGELFAVLGPSGSGKTTLLRLLAGLERPSAGSIRINKTDVFDIPPAQRDVGMVFQNFSLWPHMSVFENVAFGVAEHHRNGTELEKRVDKILKMLDIAETRDFRPDCLSVGQQQRVALARALVSEPRLLLLDDPFSNLEYELRVQMRHDLYLLQRKLGITSILVTHDQEDALSIADRVAVVAHGTIQQVGTPAAIYDFPNSMEVARFVGVTNFLPGNVKHIESQLIEFFSHDIGHHRWPISRDAPSEGPSVLSIRPHALHIAPIDSFRDGRYLWLEGTIRSSEFLGEVVRYQIDIGSVSISVNQAHFTCSSVTPSGTPVLVGFDPSRSRLFPVSAEMSSVSVYD